MSKSYVISVATAGDKAIAGPLVATAVVLDTSIASPKFVWAGTNSRRPQSLADFDGLPAPRKVQIGRWLRKVSAGYSFVTCTVRQLNTGDVREVRRVALGRAVYRAVEHALFQNPEFRLHSARTHIVVSGLEHLDTSYVGDVRQVAYPERQGRPWQLDAAYALARVYRDNLMSEADRAHPEYEFALNNGYASVTHRMALEQLGVTPLHRDSSPLVREVKDSL